MALIIRLWCLCFCIISLVFLQGAVGVPYSGDAYYSYGTCCVEQNLKPYEADISVFNLDGSHILLRRKRYLAADVHSQHFGVREDENYPSPMQEHHDDHSEVTTASSTINSSAVETISDTTRLPSFSTNSSEPRTGGNYVPAKSENVTNSNTTTNNNNTSTSITDSNRTSQSKNSTTNSDVAISSTPVNQIPVTQADNTNVTLTNSTTANDTAALPVPNNSGSTNNTNDVDDIMIAKFPEVLTNKTLVQHNISKTLEDHHLYYNSSLVSNDEQLGHSYWVNMTNRSDVKVNTMLSQSHRRAATVKLSFDFPFYGHLVRNVTIATGGFLYTGEYVHSWLAATQYIAPLMANFDTSLSSESYVKYVDNGTAFTVQWDKVKLQDKPSSGDFTFQATLHNTGDIVFVYQNVPVVIDNITDDYHPVKVGLSDAYIIDRTIFFVRRKTIYEYHRVHFDRQEIGNWTVIYLYALPTCLEGNDCQSCLTHITTFNCKWCPKAKRCSNGMDRHRQEWLQEDCDSHFVMNVSECPSRTAGTHDSPTQASSMGQDITIAVEGTPGIRTKGIPLSQEILPGLTSVRKSECPKEEMQSTDTVNNYLKLHNVLAGINCARQNWSLSLLRRSEPTTLSTPVESTETGEGETNEVEASAWKSGVNGESSDNILTSQKFSQLTEAKLELVKLQIEQLRAEGAEKMQILRTERLLKEESLQLDILGKKLRIEFLKKDMLAKKQLDSVEE